MLNVKKWLAMILALSLLFNLIPMNILADTLSPVSAEESQTTETETEGLDLPSKEVSDEGNTTPTEGDEIPEEGNDTPTEGDETPEEGNDTPTEGDETPEEENTTPAEGDETPEEENTTPAEGDETPEEENTTPAEGDETPDESDNTSAEDEEIVNSIESFSMPEYTDPDAKAFAERLISAGYATADDIGTIIDESDTDIKLTISGAEKGQPILILLSNMDLSVCDYSNWTLHFDSTGSLNLTGTITVNESKEVPEIDPDTGMETGTTPTIIEPTSYSFQGFGGEGKPFTGKFTGQTISFQISQTLFNELSVTAALNNNGIEWSGTEDKPILTKKLIADGTGRELAMPLVSATRFSPYIGELTDGTGLVTLPALNYSLAVSHYSDTYPSINGNLSLACNSMGSNTKLQVTTLSLPTQRDIDLRGTGNVGTLVGDMAENAELYIANPLDLNARLDGKNAGGLVGAMAKGSVIQFGEDASVSISAELNATGAAGGIAGSVTTATGPLGSNANVELNSVKANGSTNSGVLYGTCTVTGNLIPLTGVSFGETKEVSGPGNCGGLFGTLTLNGDGKCTISGTKGSNLAISSTLTSAANTTKYGGIAGALSGDEGSNALVVDYCNITSNVSVQNDATYYPQYLGGIVADQQTVTLDARNSTIQVNDPKTKDSDNCGFGGVAALVGNGALLIADTITIQTNNYASNPRGGGVAGLTGVGSIVYLKGSLNLSACVLTSNANSGQIVAKQNCSLIYAPGVDITRYSKGLELDDIGNYGELYRINSTDPNDSSKKPFLSVDENYVVKFNYQLTKDATGYTLSTKEDYACLALAWQSRGAFATVDGIDNGNWSGLKSSTITLGGDIDLTDCGIGSLTRDVYSKDDTFSGTLSGEGNGVNYKITLDIGAKNPANTTQVSTGDGRIYRHNATGLFAALDSSATVSNLTLAGSIRLSNNKLTSGMYSGALAAQVTGSRVEGSMLSKVSTSVVYAATVNGGYALYLGGLIGQISGSDAKITFDSDTSLAAEITLSSSGVYTHIGGAIGAIGESSSATITCDGATLGGKIEETVSVDNLYAGGLIGTIWPASSKTRKIEITDLNVNGFTFSGNAKLRMGGILGGIWADTDVTLVGLTVSDATLKANGAAALGGLVYRASGKWTVSSVDLSGLTISAENAAALGLLVCHGEPYTEPINGTTSKVGGLYLEMTQYWDTGYRVPADISFGSGVFDEFVAYTAYRSTDGSYDITHNGSGIISLLTDLENNKYSVNMTSGKRNTYVNRTTVGQGKKTNEYSRYYYNLQKVNEACDGGGIDTAEELLIWSVYRYAYSNLQQYFFFNGVVTSTIGGTAEKSANFNMEGLSYFPVDIGSENICLEYADVKFYNKEIEDKETPKSDENKSTRGTDSTHTQHYTMHCALFHDFEAESTTANMYTLTVNGVSFDGTVGVINGGSGALICGKVEGLNNGTNTAVCKVVLAEDDKDNDEGKNTKAVKLSGISVSPEGDYTPVLINSFADHSALEANYITTEQDSEAGSSLFGKVEKNSAEGSVAAVNVSIVLEGTIKLNETKDKVFTQATLFHSLHFSDGSASYNFGSDKDENESHNATYGKELAADVSVEYAGLQGNYLDGTPIPLPSLDTHLPYVAHSPASNEAGYQLENNWHEVAVNVRFTDLTDGCGTYGHPYLVDADTLISMANYINTGRPSNGWKLCVPNDLNSTTYYTAEDAGHDVEVEYRDGKFWNGNTEYSGNVRAHLQSAYYQLVYATDENGNAAENTITLNNFSGIGTNTDWAFTGVITGKIDENSCVSVTLSGGSSAFIKYSYGSVVRDVNFTLNQKPTLNRSEPARPNSVTEAKRAPDTFFGGVIGCVLGGDNIIENVGVSTGDDFNVTPTGSKSHLVPIGGHVGVIAGGGVIFRGTCTSDYAGEANYYYRNPFIGRVLGGYAFYEGDEANTPNNGNSKEGQNYRINRISSSDSDLNWDNGTLTVNSAQGLLVLSAIVSSGAGSTQSVAYANGVARNAAYNKIGKPESEAQTDFEKAKSDKAGTASYLLQKFTDCTGRVDFCTSGTEGINIQFAEKATFNMDSYGNGYRGLSARYVSNAAYKTNGADASTVVLRVNSFDGQNATVQNINMDVREYHDDDFHAASMGGIFNILWTKKDGGGGNTTNGAFAQNLTLKDCKVILEYYDSNNVSGGPEIQADKTTLVDEDGLSGVTVGGFIGSVSDVGISLTPGNKNSNYLFKNIHIVGTPPASENSSKNCIIVGPTSAGGLVGASAMTSDKVTGYPGKLLSNGNNTCFGPNFLNCSYSYVDITGVFAAGGLIGVACASNSAPHFNSLGSNYSSSTQYLASSTVTTQDFVLGQNSKITAKGRTGMAGGIFGIVGMRLGINYPSVNTQTALSVAGQTDMRKFSLNSVKIISALDSTTLYGSNGIVNGADKSPAQAASGGAIGRISNVNPTYFFDVNLNNCQILSENTNTTSAYAGGIVSNGYTNTSITIQHCEVNNTTISCAAFAGGMIARGDNSSFKLDVSDCKVESSTIKGRAAAGGIVGTAGVKRNTAGSQTYNLFNILIKNTTVKGTTNDASAGRLFGWVQMNDASNNITINAVGISAMVSDPTFKVYSEYSKESDLSVSNTKTFPDVDENHNGATINGNIVYADYLGMDTTVADKESPYVTVNPNYTLSGVNKLLTGDMVGLDVSNKSVAAQIWAEQKLPSAQRQNYVTYQNISTIISKDVPEVSTFSAVQGCGPENLPVLTIKNGNATAIEDYLNVITNGGYGTMPKSQIPNVENKVTLSVLVYYYDDTAEKFALATPQQLEAAPASVYLDGTTIKVRGNSYDNTRNRFSLVEAAFTVEVNGEKRTYTVSVPVMVIRQLQYTSMVTFTYGAEFDSNAFANLKTHVLESTGNPFTAYLSYHYNQEYKGSATGAIFAEYDWQSYLDSGGNMLSVDKTLAFSRGLPDGTQIILVDCQDGNRAYKYTTSGYVNGSKTEVNLGGFTSVSDGTTAFQPSMADVLRVTAEESDAGGFVVLENDENVSKATVRRNGVYYRPYNQDTDSKKQRWLLKVPTELDTNVPTENYFLVINVPDQNNPAFYINGKLTTELKWNMPNSGTQIRRSNPKENDNGNDNESTYQISAGYIQNLVPERESEEVINLLETNSKIQVALTDTITFSKDQAYGDNDALFVKFAVSLDQYTTDSEGTTTSEEGQFPVGTSGTVYFYIQDSDGQYYNSDGSTATGEASVGSYDWISNGANMELLLSADGTQALDLVKIRQEIKRSPTLDPQIIITAKMDVVFDSQEVLNRAVPASDPANLDKWAQLHYTALVAIQASSLDYTANRTSKVDEDKYYRGIAAQAVLSMDGVEIDQLGVNPLQLVEAYQKTVNNRNASRIEMTAALNLENLPNYQATLQNTKEISFSLSLWKRSGSNYVQVTSEEAQSRIAFRWQDGSPAWNWTVTRNAAGQFMDGEGETALDLYDSGKFTFPLTAYVFTDQTDFANYQIQLSVQFTLSDSQDGVPTNRDDAYVVYTYACIKPSFYEFENAN